jgi:hypothetical protein
MRRRWFKSPEETLMEISERYAFPRGGGHPGPHPNPVPQNEPTRDTNAYQRIGRVITGWARLENEVDRSIWTCQTVVHLRNRREWVARNPGKIYHRRAEYLSPAEFKLKLRYLRILIKACLPEDLMVRSELDRWLNLVLELQCVRNLFAHGQLTVAPFFHEASVIVAWPSELERWRASLDRRWERAREAFAKRGELLNIRPPTDRVLYFDQLDRIIADQISAIDALQLIMGKPELHTGPPVQQPDLPK